MRIVVPILAPSILVVTILSTIRALESFETELILALRSASTSSARAFTAWRSVSRPSTASPPR